MKKETKMGRKPKDGITREEKITIKLSKDEIKRIIELSEFLDMPKTVLVRNLVLSGLDEAELLKKLGFLSVVKNIKKTSEFLILFKEIKDSKTI